MNAPMKKLTPAEKAEKREAQVLVLSRRWATLAARMDVMKAEKESLEEQLLEAGLKIGDKNDYVHLGGSSRIDVDDPDLLQVLRTEDLLKSVEATVISAEKLRAAATLNENLAKALQDLFPKSPRFEQAAKKAAKADKK